MALMAAWAVGIVGIESSASSAVVAPPEVSVGNASVVEGTTGNRTLEIPVTLAQPATTAFSVSYDVQGVTAVAGLDFTPESGSLSFKARNKKSAIPVEQFVAVPVLWDAAPGTRTLSVTLSNPTAGAIIDHGVGIGTIIVPTAAATTVNVGDAGIYDGDSGTTRTMEFAVTLSAPLTVSASVEYSLVSDTALPIDDYVSVTDGLVKFPKGVTTEQISVSVYPDAHAAPDRVFYVDLSQAKKTVLGRSQGIGVLIDDGTEVVTPLDPAYHEATMTADRNPTNPTAFDTYGITVSGDATTINAPSTNTGGNSRVVFWPSTEVASTDQESCARWVSQGPVGADDQEGLALRVNTSDGVTRAITVTKNVYGGDDWGFNVHVWDTSVPGVETPVAAFTLASVFTSNNMLVPFPWDVCAEVVGNQLSFEAWVDGQPQPQFGNTTNGGTVTLPPGYDAPGYAGWYAGHLVAGDSLVYDELEAGPLSSA